MSLNFFDRIKQSTEIEFICEFQETEASINPHVFEEIYENIAWVLNTRSFIGAIGILDENGLEIMTISLNEKINEDFKTVGRIVSQMNPTIFFEALTNDIDEEGLGHLKFDYFEIVFARIISPFYVSFFIIDKHVEMFNIMQMIVELIQKIFEDTPKVLQNIGDKSLRTPISSLDRDSQEQFHPPVELVSDLDKGKRGSPVPKLTDTTEYSKDEISKKVHKDNTALLSLKKRIPTNLSDEQEKEKNIPITEANQETSNRKSKTELKAELKAKIAELED